MAAPQDTNFISHNHGVTGDLAAAQAYALANPKLPYCWTDTTTGDEYASDRGDGVLRKIVEGAEGGQVTPIASPGTANAIVSLNAAGTAEVADGRFIMDKTAGAGFIRELDANNVVIRETAMTAASRKTTYFHADGSEAFEIDPVGNLLTLFGAANAVLRVYDLATGKTRLKTSGTAAAPLSTAAGLAATTIAGLVRFAVGETTLVVTFAVGLGITATTRMRVAVLGLDGAVVRSVAAVTGANNCTFTLSAAVANDAVEVGFEAYEPI